MCDPTTVEGHYSASQPVDRVIQGLAKVGLGDGDLTWADLAAMDQFHTRGLAATQELAEALVLSEEDGVLDVGCGLGGPARYLAANYGCHVTGIDLTEAFIQVASSLAERMNLSHKTSFLVGNALELPFSDSKFDAAWTQHVAMNIQDKGALYREVHRVLKPGGKFAIYDAIEGDGEPFLFPVPWARTPNISFLLSENAMKSVLQTAGFTEMSWTDSTAEALKWMDEVRGKLSQEDRPALNLTTVLGPDFPTMAANHAKNMREGKVRVVQAIFQRD